MIVYVTNNKEPWTLEYTFFPLKLIAYLQGHRKNSQEKSVGM